MFKAAAVAHANPAHDQRTDRRRHQRVKVCLFGRFMLPDRREFPCQTRDMSPGGVALTTPVQGAVGERVVVYLDKLGRVEGRVARLLPDGFALQLDVPAIKRDRMADQLTWLANAARLGIPEDRRHERIQPRNASTILQLENGRTFDGRILDVSLSGVALLCDARPPLGAIVTIGKTRGRVVRHIDNGVAIEFTRVLRAEYFDENIEL